MSIEMVNLVCTDKELTEEWGQVHCRSAERLGLQLE